MSIEDEMKTEKMDEPSTAPVRNDLYGRVRAWALWRIRKKNLQAQLVGGGQRVPLDDPRNQL